MAAKSVADTSKASLDIAGSAWVTALAALFGLCWSITLGFSIYLMVQGGTWSMETTLDDVWVFLQEGKTGPLIAFLIIEQVLNVLEIIARKRSHVRGWTIPLIFLPFGRTMRWVIIEVCCLMVLMPKMMIYLLFVAVAPIFDLVFGRIVSIGRGIDFLDQIFEYFERVLAVVYNLFYFTKIDTGADGLTIWFNRVLSMWCVHHSEG